MKRLFLLFPALLLLLAGCTQSVHGSGSLAIGRTMRELTAASTLIVIATPLQSAGTRNLARMVSDTTKEANDIVVLGRDYDVRVESVIKGTATPGSHIVVSLSTWHGVPGQTVGTDAGVIPFSIGARYVFFLNPLRDGTAAYGQGLEPFRFRLDDAIARPESEWADASKNYPDQTLDSLVAQITAAAR